MPEDAGEGGPLQRFLEEDHKRLDALLRRAVAAEGSVDMEAYAQFRSGLLRHIAMEEKVLIPELVRLEPGGTAAVVRQIHADHAALASLLVPTPTHEIVSKVRKVLDEHNPLEEGPDGLYIVGERMVGDGIDELMERLHATPEVKPPRYVDGPRVQAHIESLLRARTQASGR